MVAHSPSHIRSLLFVPADSQRKLDASLNSEADALIFDLEDSVPEEGKRRARNQLSGFLAAHRGSMAQLVCVRINGFATAHFLDDLAAIVPHRPDAVVLPKCRNADDVHRLSDFLTAYEHALLGGTRQTSIIAMATETSEGVFGLSSYRNAPMRLRALMWGVDDLAADLGALSSHAGRELTTPFSIARTMCLLAAAQAGVDAIDAVSTKLGDDAEIEDEAGRARRDGFAAKAAGHPSHIAAINRAFLPKEEEVAWAREVVAAFSKVGASGVVRLGDTMIDRPHLRLAHRILCQVDGED